MDMNWWLESDKSCRVQMLMLSVNPWCDMYCPSLGQTTDLLGGVEQQQQRRRRRERELLLSLLALMHQEIKCMATIQLYVNMSTIRWWEENVLLQQQVWANGIAWILQMCPTPPASLLHFASYDWILRQVQRDGTEWWWRRSTRTNCFW